MTSAAYTGQNGNNESQQIITRSRSKCLELKAVLWRGEWQAVVGWRQVVTAARQADRASPAKAPAANAVR